MDRDRAYETEYNEVVVMESQLGDDIRGKYPFHQSIWKKKHTQYMNNQETHGDLLRSTFLSGGSLHMPFALYKDSIRDKAVDIDAGRILTDAEIAHNCEGVRLFFEIDYRTSTSPLPTFHVAMIHLRVVLRVVRECFPNADTTMHIATCTKKRKQKRSSSVIELAWGIHVVFPNIVTTTGTMKLIAQLLDTRMSNLFPTWSDIIDPASYRTSNATLRPCYSYKMIQCPICVIDDKKTDEIHNKRRRSDIDIDSLFRMQLSSTCDCFSGKKVDPSIYRYIGSMLTPEDEVLSHLLHGTCEVLMGMSIVPTQMGNFTQGFLRPVDMGDDRDMIPIADILFPAERRAVSSLHRRKNTVRVTLSTYPLGYSMLLNMIVNMHEEYRHIAIHYVSLDPLKRSFLINVKGKGSRYCPYKGLHHHSNRVYFSLNLARARLNVHCFDPDCKKHNHFPNLLVRSLSQVDKYSITHGFGLPDKSNRPTISPVVHETTHPFHMNHPDTMIGTTHIPMSISPLNAADEKKRLWEEKRRLYQISSGTMPM